MRIEEERLTPKLEQDMHALVRAYYSPTPAHKGLPPYDFNWDVYRHMADAGQLCIVTARDASNALLGIALYIIVEHSHHRSLLLAECDSLSVAHTQRGNGIGRLLVNAAEPRLRERGVRRILHQHRTVYNAKPLFEKLGFEKVAVVYSKEIA